jgi:hypothetical protein
MQNFKDIHNQDLNLWLEQTIKAIKDNDMNSLDFDGLLEEIEDMAASQKRALDSYMQRLIEHILKLKYWESEKELNQKGWEKEVVNFRGQINRIIKKSPSLKNYMVEEYEEIHQLAIATMSRLFQIPDGVFIVLSKMMDEEYFG